MKFLVDTEINIENEDLFKSKDYVSVLKDAILSSPKNNCFTIGLFGEWGSGKSSIVKTVSEQFQNSKDHNIKFIYYDAWKYTNDSFRRMLLLKVQEELKFEKKGKFENFYSSKNTDIAINRKVDKRYLYGSLSVFFIALILIWLIDGKKNDLKLTITIVLSAISMLISWLGKAFNDHKITVQEPAIVAPEQFEECFNEMISLSLHKDTIRTTIQKWVKGEDYICGLEKIILVVDNIDRCTKSTAYELITTIKSFLYKQSNIVFLIPVDDEALKKHILKDGEEKEAEEFLRKFFNVTIRMKLFKHYDLYDFTEQLIKKNGFDFTPTTIDIISKEFATTPRRIIQFINNLSAELLLFEKKYKKEFRQENESLICHLLVIREEWPEFYKTISLNPYKIRQLQNSEVNIEPDQRKQALFTFLSLTTSQYQSVPLEKLEVLLSPHDRNADVPFTVLDAIFKKDLPKLNECLEGKLISDFQLIKVLIEQLEKGIKSTRYETHVNNIFEIICIINDNWPVSESQNRKIYELTKYHLHSFVGLVVDLNALCRYATVIKPMFNYLIEFIVNSITSNFNDDQDKKQQEFARRLLQPLITTLDAPDELESLGNKLGGIGITSTLKIKELNIPNEKLILFTTKNLLITILRPVKELLPTDPFLADVIFIADHVKFSEQTILPITQFMDDKISTLQEPTKDAVIDSIEIINALLRNQNPINDDNVKGVIIRCIKTLIHRHNSPVDFLDDFKEDIENKLLIDFYFICFKLTNEFIDIKEALEKLNYSTAMQEYINQSMLNLRKQYNFHLTSLRHLILHDFTYTDSNLELIKVMLFHEGDYLIKDVEIIPKLRQMLGDAIKDRPALFDFFSDIIDNKRINKIILELIDELNEDSILRLLPLFLNYTFSHLLENDEFLLSRSGRIILSAMASGEDENFAAKAWNIIRNKFMTINDVEAIIQFTSEIKQANISQIEELEKVFSSIENPTKKMEAFYYLDKLKAGKHFKEEIPVIKILEAIYSSGENSDFVDVKGKLNSIINNSEIHIRVDNISFGPDPHIGVVKWLNISYAHKGRFKNKTIREGEMLDIPDF